MGISVIARMYHPALQLSLAYGVLIALPNGMPRMLPQKNATKSVDQAMLGLDDQCIASSAR